MKGRPEDLPAVTRLVGVPELDSFAFEAVVILFVVLLPLMVSNIASRYTNLNLQEQKKKVLDIISKNDVDYYF